MRSWKKPTTETIDRALRAVKKETDRLYFFSRLENPLWITPLTEKGFFNSPPNASHLPDGSTLLPHWPELLFLRNVCRDAPDEVIRLVLDLPQVDNTRVYDVIFDMVLALPGMQSVQLKPKVFESAEMSPPLLSHRYRELLVHWAEQGEISTAFELAEKLVGFVADPEMEEKGKRYAADPTDFTTLPRPQPKLEPSDYQDFVLAGVRPLAAVDPYRVALILIEATALMIRLSLRPRHVQHDRSHESSEIKYRRLGGHGGYYERPDETLVLTLTACCEDVFAKAPECVASLMQDLRNQQWRLFERLQEHLYSLHPSPQTRCGIRKLILDHQGYSRWEHHYEFQRMLKSASLYFGREFLSDDEWESILDEILDGPLEEDARRWLGDEFTEDWFERRRTTFHRKQLRPFYSVLHGEYLDYFDELEQQADASLTDEDYFPVSEVTTGAVQQRSPQTSDALSKLGDADLLEFINLWDAEHWEEDNGLFSVSIAALAETFGTVFRETIIPDDSRRGFWLKNCELIARPVYLVAMIREMQRQIELRDFGRLNEWLQFCKWVLSLEAPTSDKMTEKSHEAVDQLGWYPPRQAVGDLVGTCLKEGIDVPVAAQNQLIDLLDNLCTGFDPWLDATNPEVALGDDYLTQGINCTRGLALENVFHWGSWLRRVDPKAKLDPGLAILLKRFTGSGGYALTLPERAVLGLNYRRALILDKAWAVEHRSDFFPRHLLSEWREAFGTFLLYNQPYAPWFTFLQGDLEFVLHHLEELHGWGQRDESFENIIGRHLFIYFLRGSYPLTGVESLLERFYDATDEKRECWGVLFDYVGLLVRNSGTDIDKDVRSKVTQFFNWRLAIRQGEELRKFTWWLESPSLDAEWRLDAYLAILEIVQPETSNLFHELDTLHEMLPSHPEQVVKCFAKLTDGLKNDTFYISTDTAQDIISVGLDSDTEIVRSDAERARENLLRRGRFDLLDLDD